MKVANRIMGIISLVLGVLCILPSIIGILAGINLMSEEEIVSRIIATILFEVFLFIGGGIATILASKPVATAISSVFLVVAGFLQVTFMAEFNLKFIGTISLLILSWVAVISIAFGVLILVFSITALIKKSKKANGVTSDDIVQESDTTKDLSDEIKKYKSLLDDGLISQDEFNEKKKQLLGL